MENSSYEALNQKKIIDLFIDGKNFFPYLKLTDIVGLHNRFGNLTFKNTNMSRNDAMGMFFEYIHKNSKTLDFLNEYILSLDVNKLLYRTPMGSFDLIKSTGDLQLPEDIYDTNIFDEEGKQKVRKYIIDNFLIKINTYLSHYDLEIVMKGDKITSNKEINLSVICSDLDVDDDLAGLIYKARESLKFEDYPSVMTKSKSIVEAEFKDILKRKNIDYTNYSKNFNNLRMVVNRHLGLVKQGEWSTQAKQLVKGINITFDTLLSLRNSFSDSHGGNEYRKIKKAEATLSLNAAIALSVYYEDIYDRQKKKLS
ncbi:hypothetical protein AKUH4B503X_01140 [Apilactobacillus kunkeei]|nr:hypothetical protein AKUH4B503X_01140 [Apilactobacillus kunkeei]